MAFRKKRHLFFPLLQKNNKKEDQLKNFGGHISFFNLFFKHLTFAVQLIFLRATLFQGPTSIYLFLLHFGQSIIVLGFTEFP
jgi:hypothetical protein